MVAGAILAVAVQVALGVLVNLRVGVNVGGTMTMHLAWNDRSNSEDGYKVYRDQQVIAALPPNSTSYLDVAFVATGKKLSYSVEAFNQDWQASTSTITYGCRNGWRK